MNSTMISHRKGSVMKSANIISSRARVVCLTACAFLFVPGFAMGDISVVAKTGTLGNGVEIKYKFLEKLTGRLAYTKVSAEGDYDGDDDGDTYTGTLNIDQTTLGLIADWHPFGNGFRLSIGAMSNDSEARATARGSEITLGENDYMGEANGKVDFKSTAPYIGFGWSSQNDGLSFDFELGASFLGTPMSSFSGTATASGVTCNFDINTSGVVTAENSAGGDCSTLQTDVESEYMEFSEDLDTPIIYPVLSFGIHYRF